MKPVSKYPCTMANHKQPNFYFSAYPLKAITNPDTEKRSYLHIYTRSDKKKKYADNMHVLPMINPYKEKFAKPVSENKKFENGDHIQERDTDWFACYE